MLNFKKKKTIKRKKVIEENFLMQTKTINDTEKKGDS